MNGEQIIIAKASKPVAILSPITQLSGAALESIGDGRDEIFLSAASTWEIAFKRARGRLMLPEEPEVYVAKRMTLRGFQPLPIQLSHTLHVFHLPEIHQDPFDRLLIVQSQLEDLPDLNC